MNSVKLSVLTNMFYHMRWEN